ncbi:MAG TPA: sigma-70 family RNA polymerase sigma factor [Verrucomicrobiae bacterium]|jgi:RNA polymerase sigma factor (sigma-70 family)
MHELDDIALLREYVERDSESAFATLVTRHIDRVYSVALRHTGNTHQAEEITQAVFVILARKSKHLRKSVILEGWLYQTARLTAVTFVRSEIRRARREQEAHMQTLLNENDSGVWPQIAPLLDAAMAGLNETDRHAVVLRFFDGKSMKEVGAALGASEDAAKMRLNRAVEKLRKFFTKRGVVLPAAVLTAAISANSVQAAPVGLAKTISVVAVAKGAAASSSTLTLIKGALKIMAWTKAKTAAVATVAVMLTASTTTLVVETVHLSRVGVYQPIPDNEPEITARVRGLKMEELSAEDCTPEFWRQLQQSPLFNNPAVVKGLAAAMGPLQTVKLVERTEIHGRPNYLYRMKYQKMNVLFLIVFDGEKIAYAKGYPEPK